ncbi:MAG: DAK2 domain-containing protein, partial [Chloroflexota bacterium]
MSGSDFRQMLAMGSTLLEENVELVNSLNVFPVPDGDTGTNMLLTIQSALEEVSKVSKEDFCAVAQAAAHGSLMGARGNSGVILSQILRGISRSADSLMTLDGQGLAAALKEGANTAYRGIGKPVEGTMLTVARESSDAAVAAAKEERDVGIILRKAVEAGRRSLERTPDLLPTLKEAGVVDAGGQGYLLLLEGLMMVVTGERTPSKASLVRKVPSEPVPSQAKADYGYCTEVLIRGRDLPIEEMRERMEGIGTSVIVVGEPDLVHAHVHSHQPGDVLNVASSFGVLEKVKVENMQLQHTAYLDVAKQSEAVQVDGVGTVAVAMGSGLARVFRDLGAAGVVHGGQSMNPSIEELVHGATHSGFS